MSAGGFDRQGSLIRQLQGAFGGNRFSDIRTVTTTVATGVVVIPTDTTGVANAEGIIVIELVPVSHWSFTWNPLAVEIVVNNTGASQSMTFKYIVVGS